MPRTIQCLSCNFLIQVPVLGPDKTPAFHFYCQQCQSEKLKSKPAEGGIGG